MKIEFTTGNQTFEDYGDVEVKRILEKIISEVENGWIENRIIDINGNIIGHWSL